MILWFVGGVGRTGSDAVGGAVAGGDRSHAAALLKCEPDMVGAIQVNDRVPDHLTAVAVKARKNPGVVYSKANELAEYLPETAAPGG
jgi:hypothetical protein